MHYCFAVFMILILQIEKKKSGSLKNSLHSNYQKLSTANVSNFLCFFFLRGGSIDYHIYYYTKIIINNYIKALESLQNYKING